MVVCGYGGTDLSRWSTMGVSANLCLQVHLQCEETEQREQHDDTWHGWVVLDQEVGKTWIAEGSESRGHKLSTDQSSHASLLGAARTWTKAVAINTPVPKCLHAKKILGGIFTHDTFFATTGNPAPGIMYE